MCLHHHFKFMDVKLSYVIVDNVIMFLNLIILFCEAILAKNNNKRIL